LKTDLFSEEVFVFTPKGDIISMQKGSTPVDFAYRIHTAIGNTCVGAKINGKIVTLDTTLETGDRVDILTSAASKGPSIDWLKLCKTQQAKAKIRQFFKKEMRGENIEKGRDMLEREAKRHAVQLPALLKPELYEGILKKYGFLELDDIFCAIGYGGMAASYAVARMLDEQRSREAPALPKLPEEPKKPLGKPVHGIYVEGESDMLVRFAKCCNPVPGDEIVGYITRGRGVTVHKSDCVNANTPEHERVANVTWAEENADTFVATIQVIAYDHVRLLGELAIAVSNMGIPITAASAKVNAKKTSSITLVVQVVSREQVDRIITMLQRRSDVVEVFRGVS
jgi:GTP pyrophosphokinase